jgi:hypothetical protein
MRPMILKLQHVERQTWPSMHAFFSGTWLNYYETHHSSRLHSLYSLKPQDVHVGWLKGIYVLTISGERTVADGQRQSHKHNLWYWKLTTNLHCKNRHFWQQALWYVCIIGCIVCGILTVGHKVALLVEALCYKAEGHRFNSRWGHSDFSLT